MIFLLDREDREEIRKNVLAHSSSFPDLYRYRERRKMETFLLGGKSRRNSGRSAPRTSSFS